MAKRVLLSVGRYEIRSFADLDLPIWPRLWQLRSDTSPKKRHFFVSFDGYGWDACRIPVHLLGTMSEIRALRGWLQRQVQISSVLVVSSGPHLRRIRMCCRHFLPRTVAFRLIAAPSTEESPLTQESSSRGWRRSDILLEWSKVLLYGFVLMLYKIPRLRGIER